MNEPNDPGAPTEVLPEPFPPEPFPMPAGTASPPAGPPVDELPAEASPAEEQPAQESPADESPVVRHDPFASMRGAPWMDRRLSPSGRAAYLLRRELEAFPVIEGRDPNHADLDAIVKRTVDYIAPILKREQATDAAYDELEKRRAARIVTAQTRTGDLAVAGLTKAPGNEVLLARADNAGMPDPIVRADFERPVTQLGPEACDERTSSQR